LKHVEKNIVFSIIISEEVITAGELRERIKECESKHVKDRNRKKTENN